MRKTLTSWEWQFSQNLTQSPFGASWKTMLLGIFLLFSFSQTASAWNLPPDPSCDGGSFVWDNDISYDGCDVYSDVHLYQTTQFTIPTSSYPAAFSGPVTININEYVSWDGYCGRENTGNQPHEQWKVVFVSNGVIAWQSAYTADLPTGDMDTHTSGALGSHFFPNGVDEIILVHWNDWQYGEDDYSCANSVYPASVCFGYEEASDVSISCPSNINLTADVGQNTAIASWAAPTTSTTCTVGGIPDCSQVANYKSGFIYMGEYNGSKYYCSNGSNFSWNSAKNLSAAAGGHLVTINNAVENEFVRNLIGSSDAWIGYSDFASEGNFSWANGENPGYENWKCWSWNNCEPSGGSENFTRMLKSDGKWTDRDASYRAEFVMEIPCPGSSMPSVVTLAQINGQSSGSSFAVGTHTITYQATDDCGNTENCSFTVTVEPGQSADPASVGNFVFSDTNGNGIQDAGEPGIPGVFVMITDCNGNWINNMTTDANGMYSFTDLTPGEYKIKFVGPLDYTLSPTDAGGNDATDSDVNQGWTGFTDCFTLASGENNTTIDAGFIPSAPASSLTMTCSDNITVIATTGQTSAVASWIAPNASSTCSTGSVSVSQTDGPTSGSSFPIGTTTISYQATDGCGNYKTCSFTVTVTGTGGGDPASVGNFVFSDENGNGIQDAGEAGIPGVFVMLTNCAGDYVSNTTTDANGAYLFTDVTPGSYKVKFALLSDYTYSPMDAGSNDAVDSDVLAGWTGFTECFDVAGQDRLDIDAGFVPANPGTGCDNFTDGGTINGVQTICSGTSAATLNNVALPTGGSGGIEYLWMSLAGTSCPNNSNLAIAGANDISYSPGVLTETTTFRRCARRVGCTEWAGESNCITVTVDQTPGCGGGGSDPASVGDFVFNDMNGNGIQDAGEPGIADVFIMLTDCDGNWKGQTTSDADGAYSFSDVAPGSYKIKFVAPAGYTVSPTKAGSDDTVDSDLLQGWTGFTACFDLASGQDRTDIDAGFIGAAPGGDLSLTCSSDLTFTAPAGQTTAMVSWTVPTVTTTCSGSATLNQMNGPSNNALLSVGTHTVSYSAADDCGNYETCSFSITVDQGQPVTPASVGNFVWSDTNGNGIQDAGEPGMPNVFVMLTDCDGNWKGQTTTDANGAYMFNNVVPGSYKIKFVGPVGVTPSPTNAGTNSATDSDLLQGWTGFTECFDLASGQNKTDIDAGFIGGAPVGELTFDCNPNMNVDASDASGSVVTFSDPTASSTCTTGGVTVVQTSGPSSGSFFAVGAHTVTYTATDDCGNTETCSFTITVTYNGPAICTTRTISDVTVCNGSKQSTFWAEDLVYGMSNISKSYELVSGGVFTEYEDGTARFTGTVANIGNSNAQFAFDYTLTGKTASNSNPHGAYCFNESMSDWYYYSDMTGTLTGVGALAGAQITSSYSMYLPQIGTGANLHQNVFGFTAWVSINVVSQPNNSSYSLDNYGNAHGDLNFNLSGDPATCAPDISVCATREVTSAYQCNADMDYGFFARNFVDQFSNNSSNTHYKVIGNNNRLVEYSDGTAHLRMKVKSNSDSDVKFLIELDFSGRTFNAPDDLYDTEHCYATDDSDWYYYTNVTGTITGKDVMEGASINVWNVMHSFQIGTGAALFGDWNDFGGTAWLGYNVVSQPNSNYYSLSNGGSMDVNFHMTGNASPCGGSDYAAASNTIMELALAQSEVTADLTWQNNTGDVNEHFVIERSTDGINYVAIAQVESDRTEQNVVASYNFLDAEPELGINYYQVVAVTNNSRKIISNMKKANFIDRSNVTLFPNPAGEFFNIDLLPYKGQEAVITISDQLGRTVKSINLDEVSPAPLRVSLERFHNGSYNVRIQVKDGRATTKKLVVSRNY